MLGKILALLFESKLDDKSGGVSGRSVSPEEFNKYRDDVNQRLESSKKELSDFRKWAFLAFVISVFLGFTAWTYLQNAKNDMEAKLDNEIALTKDRVRIRLDAEFRDENIKKLVKDAAKEYTQTEAQSFIDREVKVKLEPDLDKTHRGLEVLARLYSLEIQARADSRNAFQEIASMANNPDEEVRRDVSVVLVNLRKQYGVLRQRQSFLTGSISAARSDGKVYGYAELEPKDQVALLGDPGTSFEMIQKMRSQISIKKDLDPYLLDLLKKTNSLAASVATTSILSERTGKTDLDIFDFSGWIGYLEKL